MKNWSSKSNVKKKGYKRSILMMIKYDHKLLFGEDDKWLWINETCLSWMNL